jgi:bifunctional non-homologous end joining protein LigD
MTTLLPELADLPGEAAFDGVAFADGRLHFPLVCERLLHGDTSIPLTYVIFDLLALDGEATIHLPYRKRRELLDGLTLADGPWFVAETFDDGAALFSAVCDQGLEGIIAKRRSQPYRPGERAWIRPRTRLTGATARSLSRSAARSSADTRSVSPSSEPDRSRTCFGHARGRPDRG